MNQEQKEFKQYLENLSTPEGDSIRSLWTKIINTDPDVPLPMCSFLYSNEDNLSFAFSWSYESVYLEINYGTKSNVYIYFNNRVSKISDDVEIKFEESFPEKTIQWIKSLRKHYNMQMACK